MTKTVRLNLLNLFLLIVLMFVLNTNTFESFSIYLVNVLPIIIGNYVLITNIKKQNSDYKIYNKFK